MQSYPADLPKDALTSLVSIVKSGTIVSDRSTFGLAVWNLQGYIQGKALGTPVLQSGGPNPPITSLVEAQDFCLTINTDPQYLQAFDWTTLKPLLLWALQELLVLLA